MDRWQCEILDPEQVDKKELLGFLQEEYGQTGPAQPDYFDWYCLQNPTGRAAVPTIRDPESGKLIGQYWLVPLRAEIDGQVHTGVLAVNVLAHRDYRRQRVMRAIRPYTAAAMRERGIEFSIGFPNQAMVKATQNYADSSLVGRLDLLVRPLNWSLLERTRLGRLPLQTALQATAGAVWPLVNRSRPMREYESGFTVHETQEYASEFDDFWDRVRGKYPVMFTRDAAFMRWRYQRHPRHRYTTLLAQDGSRVAGYITLRSAEIRGFLVGAIVDFLVEPSEQGQMAGNQLVAEATERLQARRLHLAAGLVGPGTQERCILRQQGFVALPHALQPQPVLVSFREYVDTLPMSIIHDIRNWHLTLGDFDIV